MRAIHILASLLLIGCATTNSGGGAPVDESATNAAPTPAAHDLTFASPLDAVLLPAKRGFTLRATAESAPKLAVVVAELELVTGVHFLVDSQVAQRLASVASGLQRDLEVPASDAWRVVETMLVRNDFALMPSGPDEPVLISIVSASQSSSSVLKASAVLIDASEVDRCADHPAVIFTTVLDADPLDARQTSTSLRQMWPDQQTQSILPQESGRFILTGFGPDLLRMTQLLRTMADGKRAEMDKRNAASEKSELTRPVPTAR